MANRTAQAAFVLIVVSCLGVFFVLQNQAPSSPSAASSSGSRAPPSSSSSSAQQQHQTKATTIVASETQQQRQQQRIEKKNAVTTPQRQQQQNQQNQQDDAGPMPPPPHVHEELKHPGGPRAPPPASASSSAEEQSSSNAKKCPTNRFVERYFATDPISLQMAARAWQKPAAREQQQQQQSNAASLPSYIRLRKSGVNSVPGHTGSNIPDAFRELLETYTTIDENAEKEYGAAPAVEKAEASCGWDGVKARFSKNPDCLDKIKFQQQNENTQQGVSTAASSADDDKFAALLKNLNVDNDAALSRAAPHLLDIVIPTIRDLDFLEKWRDFIEPFHLILVQDGDPTKMVKIPDWADYELHNRNDIESTLGSNSWIISKKDASIRNFGFLISKKPYVYTLDDDCFPVDPVESATTPEAQGGCSTLNPKDLLRGPNPILQHLRNLIKPSSPYFFNTIYDGYRDGSDFVRGYPYSMRDGVPTVVSHGLWLNVPDYDAPTQLVKPLERNKRHVDAIMTIPAGVLFPLCSMNVAFDRKLIGPAFMQGLMGVGQPWARYDDMFAGWASKAVADHLGFGVKSGAPYIFHNKASNPFTNLKKEYKGLWWQEVVIAFFNRVQLPENCTTPEASYRALALQIRAELTPMHSYFDRLATAMIAWVDSWELAAAGKLRFKPSRSSIVEEGALVRMLEKPAKVERHGQSGAEQGAGSSAHNRPQQPLAKAYFYSAEEDVALFDERQNRGRRPPPPRPAGCMTYRERYSECLRVRRRLPMKTQREYFRRIAGAGRDTTITEAALLRISPPTSSSSSSSSSSPPQPGQQHQKPSSTSAAWTEDFWLSVCSFVIEASGSSSSSSSATRRDVFLLVQEGFESSVPPEFKPLISTHSEMLAQRMYSTSAASRLMYAGGANTRSDLMTFIFFKLHPQYNWAWVVKADVRYAGVFTPQDLVSSSSSDGEDNKNKNKNKNGGWGVFFDNSRRVARESDGMPREIPYQYRSISKQQQQQQRRHHNNSGGTDSSSSEIGGVVVVPDFGLHPHDAHFIWWNAPIRQYSYWKNPTNASTPTERKYLLTNQWHLAKRDLFVGNWKMLLENKKWVGAFLPAYGISRSLAYAIDFEVSIMNRGHVHEEVSVPVTAQLRGMKIFPFVDNMMPVTVSPNEEGGGGGDTSSASPLLSPYQQFGSQIYFEWPDRARFGFESAPMYVAWMSNTAIDAKTMTNFSKGGNKFAGLNCLSNFMLFPVNVRL